MTDLPLLDLPEEDDGFDRFWSEYPHPNNMGSKAKVRAYWSATEKLIDKAKMSDQDRKDALKAVSVYRRRVEDDLSPRMCQTWVFQRTWESYLEAPEPVRVLRDGLGKQRDLDKRAELKAHFLRDVEANYAKKAAFNKEMDRLRAKKPVDV